MTAATTTSTFVVTSQIRMERVMTSTRHPDDRLRIVAFNVRPDAYQRTAAWAARHGHSIALLVTTPGPVARRSPMYQDTIAAAPPNQEIVITTRPQRLVPIIAAVAPDLIVCWSFPYRIPANVVAIPRLGAVNLHPALLPRYRGTNAARQFYDDNPTIGATVHRIAPAFDAGPILSQQERAIPANATIEAVRAVWVGAMDASLEEGLARAVAGEPGMPQDEAHATEAPQFTDAECWLNWQESPRLLQRRVTALQMMGQTVRAEIAGSVYTIERLTPLVDHGSGVASGVVLTQEPGSFTVQVDGGAVQVAVAA
jgi:methionyl-tRNA formyltransferase